jgi:hypothetical protein
MSEESETTISHEDIGDDLRRIVIMGASTRQEQSHLRRAPELASEPKEA